MKWGPAQTPAGVHPRRASSTPRRRPSPNGSSASAQKASMVCGIARQDLFHCRAKQRPPPMLPSRRCVGSATQAARSPPSSPSPLPPSAGACGSSSSTGSRRWEPAEPVRRYEREHPGEIIRLDIKKLGRFKQIGHRITGDRKGQSNSRGVGWEYLHLAIDDHSRVACSEILPDEKRGSSLRFLFNALRFFRAQGVKVQRVMTDNGGSFRSRRYAKALRLLKNKHLRTKPYTPKTNRKAERFVQTSFREWA